MRPGPKSQAFIVINSVKIQPISHVKSTISVFNGFTTPQKDKKYNHFAALLIK